MLCKSILYEFAVKKNLDRPIYNTRYTEGPSSVYICHLMLGGKTYKGELAGSKQMAKQVAAQAAIESLLGMLIYCFFSLLRYIMCKRTVSNTLKTLKKLMQELFTRSSCPKISVILVCKPEWILTLVRKCWLKALVRKFRL